MAICNQCGERINDGVGFCASCGARDRLSRRGWRVSRRGPGARPGIHLPECGGSARLPLWPGHRDRFSVLDTYKNDGFVRFHAFQSIFFTGLWIAGGIVWNILWALVASVSGWLALIGGFVSLLVVMGGFFYWIFLMYKAYKGQRYMIPVIGRIAAQQAGR